MGTRRAAKSSRNSTIHANHAARCRIEVWEDRLHQRIVQPMKDDLGKDVPVVEGGRQVARAEELLGFQPGPIGVHLPSDDVAAHQEHHAGMPMIRAQTGVLIDSSPELRHDHQGHAVHVGFQIGVEGCQALCQLGQETRHESFAGTLGEVSVPPTQIEGGRFQSDVGLDQGRDLAKPKTVVGLGIGGAASRQVDRRVEVRQRVQDVKRLAPESLHFAVTLVELGQGRLHLLGDGQVAAQMEVGDRSQGRHRNGAAQAVLDHFAQSDGAQRRGIAGIQAGEVTGDPARGRAAQVRQAALHQLHRLKVAARFVRGAAGVDDRQMPGLPGRHDRAQGWVQTEEAVEVDGPQRAGSLPVVRARHAQRRAMAVVSRFAVRHDDVQRVGRSAEEHDDEHIAARRHGGRREGKARHPGRPACLHSGKSGEGDRRQGL
jgi:hypothetical protein